MHLKSAKNHYLHYTIKTKNSNVTTHSLLYIMIEDDYINIRRKF